MWLCVWVWRRRPAAKRGGRESEGITVSMCLCVCVCGECVDGLPLYVVKWEERGKRKEQHVCVGVSVQEAGGRREQQKQRHHTHTHNQRASQPCIKLA